MRHCWQVDNGRMTSRTDTSIRVEWAETAAQGSLLLRSQSRIGVHTSIQTKSVQLKPLPTITTITDTAICPGDSITLQASGANTYQWTPEDHLQDASSATPTAYPRQQTTFTATGYGGNGCRARSEVNVSVHPSPGTDFDFGGNPPTISFTDQSNQATTWFWHFGDGATSTQANPTHTYQDEDFYDVTLISKNDYGCRDTSEQRIAVFYATSIDNNNPSGKQLAIQRVGQRRVEISLGEDRTRPIQIRAYTLLGKEIISRSFGSTKSIILDLTHTKSNIVILQFIWEDQTFSKKIRTGMRSIE